MKHGCARQPVARSLGARVRDARACDVCQTDSNDYVVIAYYT